MWVANHAIHPREWLQPRSVGPQMVDDSINDHRNIKEWITLTDLGESMGALSLQGMQVLTGSILMIVYTQIYRSPNGNVHHYLVSSTTLILFNKN